MGMKPVVLFIDTVCPKTYDPEMSEGCGGTEFTVMQIAEALDKTGKYLIAVEQHNRKESRGFYHKLGDTASADYVVCLRDPAALEAARSRFPKAKLYLWSHDLASPSLFSDLSLFERVGLVANLVVSNYHRQQTLGVLRSQSPDAKLRCLTVYNPISDSLKPDGSEFDKNQLCFISSPHKGLDNALAIFSYLRKLNPEFTLHVTNPGYYKNALKEQDGVVFHGSVSHSEVIALLRKSLCLFYPNTVFPETFGKVMAESNAVGTPVIAHQFGAVPEVTDHPMEFLDCRDPQAVVNRVMEFYNGMRPTVRLKPHFRLSKVIQTWIKEVLV